MAFEPESGSGVRVLLAETLDFDVVGEAADGTQALTITLDTRPEVVLMDLRMPGLGGLESTQLIKDQAPGVQVIILTAYDDFGLRVAAEQAGAYCYLPKGSSAQLICHMVLKARNRQREVEGRGGWSSAG